MADLTNDCPVAFHNVGEPERLGELPGVLLSRFPRRVREALNRRGRHVALKGVGCEIRCAQPSQPKGSWTASNYAPTPFSRLFE